MDNKNIKKASEEIMEIVKKYEVELVPVTTIFRGEVMQEIKIIPTKKKSDIVTPKNVITK